jgi:GT2 family glycosyltransferase
MDTDPGGHDRILGGGPDVDRCTAQPQRLAQERYLDFLAPDFRRDTARNYVDGAPQELWHTGAMTTVALCAVCHDRETELYRMLESAGDDDFDEVIVVDMGSAPAITPAPGVRWLSSGTNLGPAVGRNMLAAAATSDILVFLDDDARLLTPAVDLVKRLFDENSTLAITAFRVQRTDGRVESLEYPFRGSVVRETEMRPCPYFVAAGYACRRSAVQAVGGYDEELFIHGEELELSFNLYRAGWELLYVPGVVVEHDPSARGRHPERSYWPLTMRNRAIIARKYLPWWAACGHLLIWAVLTAVRSARADSGRRWPAAAFAGLRQPVQRGPLSWNILKRLHRMGGRVLW